MHGERSLIETQVRLHQQRIAEATAPHRVRPSGLSWWRRLLGRTPHLPHPWRTAHPRVAGRATPRPRVRRTVPAGADLGAALTGRSRRSR